MKNKYKIISIIFLFILLISGSYSLWIWNSSTNKNIIFNTSKNLSEYIVYDEGESKFSGDFNVGSSYLEGIYSTISINKTSEVSNISLYATINMRINSIGSNLSNNEGLKWVVTEGEHTSNGAILAQGNFLGVSNNSEIILIDNLEVEETINKYTIWIWLDEVYADANMSGETVDTVVYTQVDQYGEDTFEVTNINIRNQVVKATVVNSRNNIVSYAITNTNVEPLSNNITNNKPSFLTNNSNYNIERLNSTSWIDIPIQEQTKVYRFSYLFSNIGDYYIWFKDISNNITNKKVTITESVNLRPICSFTNLNTEINTIDIICIDNNYEIIDSDISISDLSVTGGGISISNISKERVANGYKYTLNINVLSNSSSTIMLNEGVVVNEHELYNESVISQNIIMQSIYNITYLDVGGTAFSGTHEEGYPIEFISGVNTSLDNPYKNGYSFQGYYKDINGTGDIVSQLKNERENVTLYTKWIDNIPPYGQVDLVFQDGVMTLSLSNYGDDGSGLINNYGFAMISSGTCEEATYEYQTALSKIYSSGLTGNTLYNGCIKLTDNNNNVSYIESSKIEYVDNFSREIYTTSGNYTFTTPKDGNYQLQVWGAQGGNTGGLGGYSEGDINLPANTTMHIYVGGVGAKGSAGFNGGGAAASSGGGGGGASDIRIGTDSLYARVIVAGGGGGKSEDSCGAGGAGGGLSGVGGNSQGSCGTQAGGGTQTAGGSAGIYSSTNGSVGSFGSGADSADGSYDGGGGGGGWYGGGSGASTGWSNGGGGGSGYVYTADTAVNYPSGCLLNTSHYLTNATTIAGSNSFTNVDGTGTETGHSGNGAVKISWANESQTISSITLNYDNNGGYGCTSKTVTSGSTYGSLCLPMRNGYSFSGWYTSITGGTQVLETTNVLNTSNHTIYARWEETVNPLIFISNMGNSEYVNEDISSRVTVSRGSNSLDLNTLKYIYSKNINAEPTIRFNNGDNVILSEGEGIYYLIVKVCDVLGNCTTSKSNAFYIDKVAPTGTATLSNDINNLTVNVNATDGGSGIKEYGYLIQTISQCPTSGYTSTSNNNYSFNELSNGTYYVCVKLVDNFNQSNVIVSNSITLNFSFSELFPNSRNISLGNNINITLEDGMIPVRYDMSGTKSDVVVANPESGWADYSNKEWANMVLVTDASRANYQNNIGAVINEADILGYYVWIPRYKYKLFETSDTNNPPLIEIAFESAATAKSSGTATGEWRTHPVFTFGNSEVEGFWIGKFELTGTATAPTVKPDVSSLRNQTISSFFNIIKGISVANGTHGIKDADSHMLKNSEWGAVAYLSHSTFGVGREIYINNSFRHYTGRSGGNVGGSTAINTVYTDQTSTTQFNNYGFYTWDGYLLDYNTNNKSTTRDVTKVASTTGNVYGVYDMSGGAYEYVMGYYSGHNPSAWGATSSSNYAGFTTAPEAKYYDNYTTTTNTTACNGGICYGQALSETSGWYGDYAIFVSADDPWLLRGGRCDEGADAGAFYSVNFSGSSSSYFGARVCLAFA